MDKARPKTTGDALTDAAGDGIELRCVSFGVPFRVRLEDAALYERVLALLPHATSLVSTLPADAEIFSLLLPDAEHGFRSVAGGETTAENTACEPVLEQLGKDLMVHVANYAPDRVFLHAGVVGWRGRALLLPGPSFAGKTTLTAALVRAGAVYYSDEYAVLDEDGLVHPYARDLQWRQPGEGSAQRGLAVGELNGVAGELPLRVSAVVFARYRSGAVWAPRPVSAGMAVLEMLRHTIPVQRTPARVMATLARAIEGAWICDAERGEADAAAAALLGSLR